MDERNESVQFSGEYDRSEKDGIVWCAELAVAVQILSSVVVVLQVACPGVAEKRKDLLGVLYDGFVRHECL